MSTFATAAATAASDLDALVDQSEVTRLRAESLVFDDGDAVLIPKDASPANAGAVAKLALGGPVEFSHLKFGMPVYRKDRYADGS